jgi:hypothetical protein
LAGVRSYLSDLITYAEKNKSKIDDLRAREMLKVGPKR